MKFYTDKKEQYTVFRLEEEVLNEKLCTPLKAELVFMVAEGSHNLIVDLSKVERFDTDGLEALLLGDRLCKEKGGIMVIIGANEAFVKLAHPSHLDDVFTILPTMAEAVDAIFLNEIEGSLGAEEGEDTNS